MFLPTYPSYPSAPNSISPEHFPLKTHNDSSSDSDDDLISGQLTPDTELGDDELYMALDQQNHEMTSFLHQASRTLSMAPEKTAIQQRFDQNGLGVSVHRLSNKDGIIVSVKPPTTPQGSISRAPCDIVLVLDVSNSMGKPFKLRGLTNGGHAGTDEGQMTALHAVITAAKAITDVLGDYDRIGVVTFSDYAKIIQPLIPASRTNKARVCDVLTQIHKELMTNLWAGIKHGLSLWDGAPRVENNVKAMFILTDGMSNVDNPRPAWKLTLEKTLEQRRKSNLPCPTLHTIGFGEGTESGLLQLVAKVGRGNFSYVSDLNMVATTFANAVANVMATFATRAKLDIVLPAGGKILPSDTDLSPILETEDTRSKSRPRDMIVQLDDMQYGQSRDYIFPWSLVRNNGSIQFTLSYTPHATMRLAFQKEVVVRFELSELESISQAVEDYHTARSELCSILKGLCHESEDDRNVYDEVFRLKGVERQRAALERRIKLRVHTDLDNRGILSDVAYEGEIWKAITSEEEYKRWGTHYLRSMLFAHATQRCNTFKDKGPLRYGSHSSLILEYRGKFDNSFAKFRPPESANITSMAAINKPDNACWTGECMVETATGRAPTYSLQPGTQVLTQVGIRKVRKIHVSSSEQITLRRNEENGLLITPWHPVTYRGQQSYRWVFPQEEQGWENVQYTGKLYSVLLEEDARPNAHTVLVENVWCATLGHGILKSVTDIREHKYYGDYNRILKDILKERFPSCDLGSETDTLSEGMVA